MSIPSPNAVLESLLLGTPVLGYRMPALETYYKGRSGVMLVEKGDIEALTVEILNLLEGRSTMEAPVVRNWKDIMKEEMDILEVVCQ